MCVCVCAAHVCTHDHDVRVCTCVHAYVTCARVCALTFVYSRARARGTCTYMHVNVDVMISDPLRRKSAFRAKGIRTVTTRMYKCIRLQCNCTDDSSVRQFAIVSSHRSRKCVDVAAVDQLQWLADFDDAFGVSFSPSQVRARACNCAS